MSWITVIWSMAASASLTLAGVHLVVWLKKRNAWADLVFSLTAAATAAMAATELWMMRAGTPEQFGAALRWAHIPVWAAVLSLVFFTRLYLKAGRDWLAWTTIAVRTLALVLNFLIAPNINFRAITALHQVAFLGERAATPVGIPNPLMLLSQLGNLLLAVYVADAAATAWRRGDRRAAIAVGGGVIFFVLAGLTSSGLAFWQVIHVPVINSFFYIVVVAAMAAELTRDLVRASRLAEDLHESEARFRAIFEGSLQGIFRTSPEGKVLVINPALAGMLGYESPEAARLALTDVGRQIWVDVQERSDFTRRLEEEGAVRGYECQLKRRDGTVVQVSLSARAVPAPRGRTAYYEGFILDITERKENEREMAELRLERTHLARVLTMEEVSTTLAHEINQPLGAILNNAEAARILLARERDKTTAVAEIVGDIIQDARRAGDVIRKIRGFLKKREARFERLPVRPLIEESLSILGGALALNDIGLRIEYGPDLPDVRGDRIRLQQVLMNLVTNAMDAMAGSPTKLLTVRSETAGPEMITVSVGDSGPGIAEDQRETIFQPFFTSKKSGLGLGLPICRSIVEEHGGRIWEEGRSGDGAVFKFSLKSWR